MLLTGDPGIGKTRLVAEIARRAQELGAFVLAGRSPQDALVPYQPFVEALRHYVLNVPFAELRSSARDYGAELARLVPELRRRAPGLPPPVEGEPETERYRLGWGMVLLARAVTADLDVVQASRPVLQRLSSETQETVTISCSHFLPEEAPAEVGEAMARFVARVVAGQIA